MEDMEATTFLEVLEEYTNLGPIVDFDLVPTHAQQSQVVTCSGSSTSGSLRLVRNGIGMNERASVEMEGIQNMWSVKKSWNDKEDAYLVQSFVGETRVLGVSADGDGMEDEEESEAGGTLEEVVLAGLDSTASSLYVGNVQVGDSILQITESEIRLMSASSMEVTATWSPTAEVAADAQSITVAAANDAGQIVIALRGGLLLYLRVKDASKIELLTKSTLESEVGCIDLNPLVSADEESAMDVDGALSSKLVAVGLWDDFTVRLLSFETNLAEVLSINLSTEEEEEVDNQEGGVSRRTRNNMMARSLCLVTLDSANKTAWEALTCCLLVLATGLLFPLLLGNAMDVLQQIQRKKSASELSVSIWCHWKRNKEDGTFTETVIDLQLFIWSLEGIFQIQNSAIPTSNCP